MRKKDITAEGRKSAGTAAARRQAVGRRSVLMLLGTYSPAAHRGIARFAAEQGWRLHVDMARIPQVPYGWRGDGIVAGLGEWEEPLHFLRDPAVAVIPTVDIYQMRPEVRLPRVVADHLAIGRLAGEHLLAQGWRQFAWFSRVNHAVAQLRRSGFCAAVRRLCVEPRVLAAESATLGAGAPWEAVRAALVRDLRAAPKPLGVMAFNDYDAALVEDACLDAGLRVPEDVGIIGVDNNDLVVNCLPVPLTSVRPELERIGYEGAALLAQLMDGAPPPVTDKIIPPGGVESRASTDTTPASHPLVRRALIYMRQHLGEKLTGERLAAACGTSRRTLETAFVADIQRTPHSLLLQLRLREACKRLAESGDAIQVVARACGFAHGPHFHAEFKRALGQSPRAWRLARARDTKPSL
ncbi:MAG: substrate-binding domain-containing protein [Verrucomicrobia bacterium]|nr:substrate-binding domain-containing protein [Verrucomicrobiota bacterium]